MANYTSRHTGEEIDNAVDQVASKITSPETPEDGNYLVYNAEEGKWAAAEHAITLRTWTAADMV